MEQKPGRGNVIARIRGDGSLGKGPVLLSAHLDVVEAPKDDWVEKGWKHGPFEGVIDEEDGCLYGRGTVDMKNMAAASTALLLFIARNEIKLGRDLIFAAIADEERSDSKYGAKFLVEQHPEKIDCDLLFTEVGGFPMYMEGTKGIPVMIAEKGAIRFRITAHGKGAHGSTFCKDNPIVTIGDVCTKLGKTRLRHRVTNSARVTFEALASHLNFVKASALKLLLSPRFHSYVLDYILPEKQYKIFGPLLFNVANPVLMGGGDCGNQIPTSAWVTLDTRILPGVTAAEVREEIMEVIGRSRFEPIKMEDGSDGQPELAIEQLTETSCYEQDPKDPRVAEPLAVIQGVLDKLDNGTPVVPFMVPGHTDCSYYITHPSKPVCLGFSPVDVPPGTDFAALFHGTNERVSVDGFKWGLAILLETIFDLCLSTN